MTLSRFQQMRESHSSLSEIMASSALLTSENSVAHTTGSSSSQSSSTHSRIIPHQPAVPSRLQANVLPEPKEAADADMEYAGLESPDTTAITAGVMVFTMSEVSLAGGRSGGNEEDGDVGGNLFAPPQQQQGETRKM